MVLIRFQSGLLRCIPKQSCSLSLCRYIQEDTQAILERKTEASFLLHRKVGFCSLLFALILAGGWLLDNHSNQQRSLLPSAGSGNYIVFSEKLGARPMSAPFLPREYVRILRKVEDRSPPARALPLP